MSHGVVLAWCGVVLGTLVLVSCVAGPRVGTPTLRHGDEIMVAGKLFRTGTPVVLWLDKGGYDAYRVEARFKPIKEAGWEHVSKQLPEGSTPNRYGWRIDRFNNGTPDFDETQLSSVRDGWSLNQVRDVVDQFVLHYDVCGTSERCFNVLHDHRCLSVHFMLDVDGTVYQTLDLKDRAWHAGTANSRSIGIEIANMGAYPPGGKNPFADWYAKDDVGTYVNIPESAGGQASQRVPGRYYTARPDRVTGTINGSTLEMYDLTEAQYDALIKLTATLCHVFPQIQNDYPRGADGSVEPNELSDEAFASFKGVLGHWHETKQKTDPGPALDWERLRVGVEGELRRWR